MTSRNLESMKNSSPEKIGGKALRSIDDIVRLRRLSDNDEDLIQPARMLCELANDNRSLTMYLRGIHEVCERHNDVATASLVEIRIDEAEHRTWFLREVG
jgi:starvation-inducible DNA-binding protein